MRFFVWLDVLTRPPPAPSCAQAECLNTPGVLHGRNLVYSAPTSGGKSLVAEVLAIRRLIHTGRTALVRGVLGRIHQRA